MYDIGVYVVNTVLFNQIHVSTVIEYDEFLFTQFAWNKETHHVKYCPVFESTIIVLLTIVSK